MTVFGIPFSGNEIISGLVSIGSLVIASLAYRRSVASDRRDSEAIISVRTIRSGRNPRQSLTFSQPDAVGRMSVAKTQLPTADEYWVISGDPTIHDGLVIRRARATDDADEDQQNSNTYRVTISIENIGRYPATGVQFLVRLTGTYLADFAEETETRTFERLMEFSVLPLGTKRDIQIRNIPGIPVVLEFIRATAAADRKQDLKLIADTLVFEPRA